MQTCRTSAGLLGLLSRHGVGPAGALTLARAGERVSATELEAGHRTVDVYAGQQVLSVSWFDDEYPSRLRELRDAPPVLFVRGDVRALHDRRLVAVVGTRHPSRFGTSATEWLVGRLADAGFGVVSGLALGVDGLAHETALGKGVATSAAVGNGLDGVHPAAHRDLADQIVQAGGALYAEVGPGCPPDARTLTARNRLQSGLSCGVLVAQTGVRGGTMHTVRYAMAQGKPVFCPQPGEVHTGTDGIRLLCAQPARVLPDTAPAFAQHRGLCDRFGDRPAATAVSRSTVDVMLDTFERHATAVPQEEQQPLF